MYSVNQMSQDQEEVNYGGSSLEGLYHQEGSKDFDLELDRFIYD